jgi:hypothetical protein
MGAAINLIASHYHDVKSAGDTYYPV